MTDKVIDMSEIFAAREAIRKAGQGEVWPVFLAEYADADGSRFCFEIHARDQADAWRRIALIGQNGQIKGRLAETIDG